MRPLAEFAEALSDAYSTNRYGGDWTGCIIMLRGRGYNDRAVEAILRSKWTRWAADQAGREEDATAADLSRYLQSMPPGRRKHRVRELVAATF